MLSLSLAVHNNLIYPAVDGTSLISVGNRITGALVTTIFDINSPAS